MSALIAFLFALSVGSFHVGQFTPVHHHAPIVQPLDTVGGMDGG
jgi:hypothetical protein